MDLLLKASEMSPMEQAPFKVCACGIAYTREEFDLLARLQDWHLPWGEVQEMRNCPCGSTMNVVIREGTPEEEAAYDAQHDESLVKMLVGQALHASRSSRPPPAK